MAISRTTAQRLCTKPEFELVEASFAPHVKTLSPARLRQKVARTRRLRDKYRDLARRQRLEARGKRSPQRARPAQGHDNTDRKATLFQEVLDRFEIQLGRAEPDSGSATLEKRKKGSGAAGKQKHRREEVRREEVRREEVRREEVRREEVRREEVRRHGERGPACRARDRERPCRRAGEGGCVRHEGCAPQARTRAPGRGSARPGQDGARPYAVVQCPQPAAPGPPQLSSLPDCAGRGPSQSGGGAVPRPPPVDAIPRFRIYFAGLPEAGRPWSWSRAGCEKWGMHPHFFIESSYG
jgi:hypothetical protein